MPTFLQLVNDVERESGTVARGQRLSTVSVPGTDRQEKIIEWTREAWRMIQVARSDWPWLTQEFTGPLVPGQSRYSAADLLIEDFARWGKPTQTYNPYTLYDPTEGKAQERELFELTFHEWKARYDRGEPQLNRPRYFAFDRSSQLCVGHPPDKAYTLRGEYKRTAQILTNDADLPLCGEDHHKVIVWKALLLMAENDEAQIQIATTQRNYASAFANLVNDRDEMARV